MVAASTSSAQSEKPLLHICYAPADHAWVHGRMIRELGLEAGQYHTRAVATGERGYQIAIAAPSPSRIG